MQRRWLAALSGLSMALSGCAELACAPVTIDVAAKDSRTRLVNEFRGITNDETGRGTVDLRRQKFVTEYWVTDGQGQSHRVTEEQWRDARAGQPLSACR
jgi:hypothetical protein